MDSNSCLPFACKRSIETLATTGSRSVAFARTRLPHRLGCVAVVVRRHIPFSPRAGTMDVDSEYDDYENSPSPSPAKVRLHLNAAEVCKCHFKSAQVKQKAAAKQPQPLSQSNAPNLHAGKALEVCCMHAWSSNPMCPCMANNMDSDTNIAGNLPEEVTAGAHPFAP